MTSASVPNSEEPLNGAVASAVHGPGVVGQSVETPLARLGRQIRRRTTDLLAIAILCVGGLMVGGRLSEWWKTSPDQVVSPGLIEADATPGFWGSSGRPVTLEFGSFPQALRRQTVRGSHQQATQWLTAWCRENVQQAEPSTQEVTEDERRLLRQLQSLKPVAESPNRGRVYRIDHPMLMVLGTRTGPNANESSTSTNDRVVCWGFAFPQGPDVWSLLLSSSASAAQRLSPLPEVVLPRGCTRILTLRNDAGDALSTFEGAVTIDAARTAFDRAFEERGWYVANLWQHREGRWTARFASPASDRPTTGWRGAIDIQLTTGSGGTLTGLLNFLPERRLEPSSEDSGPSGETGRSS